MKTDNTETKPNTEPTNYIRSIGGIGNYYGGLSVKAKGGKYFWAIENYDGVSWEEIPADLFTALNALEDSRGNSQR